MNHCIYTNGRKVAEEAETRLAFLRKVALQEAQALVNCGTSGTINCVSNQTTEIFKIEVTCHTSNNVPQISQLPAFIAHFSDILHTINMPDHYTDCIYGLLLDLQETRSQEILDKLQKVCQTLSYDFDMRHLQQELQKVVL